MQRILVTGATGFLGKRVCRKLEARGAEFMRTSLGLGVDLECSRETIDLFHSTQPDVVLNCASYVGGIQFGYEFPADLFLRNIRMVVNLLEAAQKVGVKRLVNPISNCTYPAQATSFHEDSWWDGPLHESVLVYGFVRKASWVGTWAYAKQFGLDSLNLIMSNMYGPEDHFNEARSHALGALIMKFVRAKRNGDPRVIVWGTGKPVREWLHVDDGAEAMLRAVDAAPSLEPVNVGVGKGISVLDLAWMVKEYVGYEGEIVLDHTKPDGALYKTIDGTRGEKLLAWRPEINFRDGVRETVSWYLANSVTSDSAEKGIS